MGRKILTKNKAGCFQLSIVDVGDIKTVFTNNFSSRPLGLGELELLQRENHNDFKLKK